MKARDLHHHTFRVLIHSSCSATIIHEPYRITMLYKLKNHSILELEEILKILTNEKTTILNDKGTCRMLHDRARIWSFKKNFQIWSSRNFLYKIVSKIFGILVFPVMTNYVNSYFFSKNLLDN